MNEKVAVFSVKFGIREEYAIEYLEQIQQQYVKAIPHKPLKNNKKNGII